MVTVTEDPVTEDPIQRLALERFGIDYLFPYQRLAVVNILESIAPPHEAGSEAWAGAESGPLRQLVLLPTGFGKSLCFQLPALLLPGPTVVVYPLLALMDDQRRRLDSLGIPCALFRGGQDESERRKAEEDLASGRAKIAITNPESLAVERLLSFIAGLRPSHVAIDEAHCVSEWGETFRPAYLELGRILERLDAPAVSAFTATASPSVVDSVSRRLFGSASPIIVAGEADRPNISYGVVRSLSRIHSLERLARELPRPLIVFSASREGVQVLARSLARRLGERELRFYHAGLEKDEKRAVEAWFMASSGGILVTTCAYGLGVDKRDIRSVVHYEAPSSVEAYLQESGRAGRDGQPATALLLSAPDDHCRLLSGADAVRRERGEAFLRYASSASGCRRSALLSLLGAPEAESLACSGCDRCEGTASELYEGEPEIRWFLSRHGRRFKPRSAAAALAGDNRTRPAIRCAGWGIMRDWEEEDILAALAMAVGAGMIRVCGRPWKGRLALPRPERRRNGMFGSQPERPARTQRDRGAVPARPGPPSESRPETRHARFTR